MSSCWLLDTNAETRAVKRLFIADNSALANSLGGPNPTLTTQALATRTAEKISQTYFGSEPWVRTQGHGKITNCDDQATPGHLRPGHTPTGYARVPFGAESQSWTPWGVLFGTEFQCTSTGTGTTTVR